MFGVDFAELMIILVVALVVIGPERLPRVTRTLGHLLGRAQRYVNNVKADISRDMAIEELRQLQQQVQQQAAHAAKTVEHMTSQTTDTVHQHMQQLGSDLSAPSTATAEATPEQKKFPVD